MRFHFGFRVAPGLWIGFSPGGWKRELSGPFGVALWFVYEVCVCIAVAWLIWVLLTL